MTKRILDVVDMQNDFMDPKGALYVKGAEKIIPRANAFFKGVQTGDFDLALIKYDTHFQETYDKNPESKQFPIHCLYDSWGWKLAVKLPPSLLEKIAGYEMNKNVFDMWADKPDLKGVTFQNDFNKKAYDGLFKIASLSNQNVAPVARDLFMDQHNIGVDTEVVMIGVASDYCVHDAVYGYLKRGCKVTILRDLVQGIGTDVPGRAKSGHIEDVVKLDCYKAFLSSGQLRVINADELASEIKDEKKHDSKNIKRRRCPNQPDRR